MLAAAQSEESPREMIPLRRAPSLSPILQRVALAANSSLDVEEVLERLVTLTLEAIPGDRCSIFLLDPLGRLVPRMAVGRIPNDAEYQRFLKTPPIDLTGESARWEAFVAGRALSFPDLASSPLVPDVFVEAFGAQSALVMPLAPSGEPLGLLAVDWTDRGHECTETEVSLVEAIGAYVALAIRNSRLYERLATKARTLERLVDLAAALNSAASLTSVLDLVCAAFADLLGTSACAVRLIDARAPGSIRTVASFPDEAIATKKNGSSMVKVAAAIECVSTTWERSTHPLVYYGREQPEMVKLLGPRPADGSVALFPLKRSEGILGYVAAAFPSEGRPDDESLASGQALAELAAAATARAHLHQELQWRLQRVEILHRLSDVVAGSAELDPALRKLNEALPAELGLRLESISIANPQLRQAIGAPAPAGEELEAIRSWRAILAKGSTAPSSRPIDGGLLVPIAHRRRVLGALKVAIDPANPSPADDDLLVTIASGCGEVVHKAGLQRELSESERRLAVVAERERIARDLHDSVGQVLTGLGMRLVEYTDDASDPMWRARLAELRDLATRGSREIRDAIQSMLFLQVRREGLARSLRDLARKFEVTTGIEVRLHVAGNVTPLATPAEDALFRVAHEALRNAERHSGASSVELSLSYGDDDVAVAVTDDGVGIGDRTTLGSPDSHFGLHGLRTLMEEVAGDLEISDLLPHGVRIEGRVPFRNRPKTVHR